MAKVVYQNEKYSSLDDQLINEGWFKLAKLTEKHFDELFKLAWDVEGGKYLNILILSGDKAFEGSGLKPSEPYHIVYGKPKKAYLSMKKQGMSFGNLVTNKGDMTLTPMYITSF